MDTRTGNIINPEDAEKLSKAFPEEFEKNFIPVEDDEMTETQKKIMRVSKHDNKSKLGKKFTNARHQRKYFFK